jgi:bifunctional UDP-N-acetylglucosamine pyrophosphorylase/glucosamine-1-phosphate N-acetyltransferase
MTSINKKKIAIIEKHNQEKLRNQAMKMGVTLKSPETVFLSNDTKYGKNIVINPYVVIGKKTKIGNNVEILSFSHIENATLEDNVNVGPFSRIRPGTLLSKGSRVGNFVEVKKSRIGKNSKINHLSYIGDALVGKNVNIGAGTITCNYDGKNKNKTKISDGAFIGSNTSLVAPIKIGKKSVVGAGSTLTKNVKNKSLSLTRTNQIEIKNYKRK